MGAGTADGGALPPTAIGAAYCKGEMCAGVNAGLVAGGLNAEAYLGALASGSMTCGGVCSGHPWYLAAGVSGSTHLQQMVDILLHLYIPLLSLACGVVRLHLLLPELLF